MFKWITTGLITLFLLFTILFTAWQELRPRTFSGQVYDCQTGEPIAEARLELLQQTIFTWTDLHEFRGISDAQGHFSIPYNIGNTVHVRTSMDDYLRADEWAERGPVRIGLLRRQPTDNVLEYSVLCKRGSECFKEVVEHGVSTLQSTCGTLKPL